MLPEKKILWRLLMEGGGLLDRTLRSQADSSCAIMKSCQTELISSIDGVTVLQTREMGFTHRAGLEQNI